MKKWTFLCLILAFVCLCSACGSTGGEESVVKKEVKQEEGFRPKEAKLKEAEHVSQDGVSVSLVGISYEDVVTTLNLHVKNETEEERNVITANLSVNGIMSHDNMSVTVPAMSEADGTVSLSNSWLGEMQIEQIAEIEFMIKGFNSLHDEVFVSDTHTFYTDAPDSYKQTYDDSGFVVYHHNGFLLSARTLQKSELSNDMELVFYAENNTDDTICIMSQDVSVNGIPVKPLFVLTVGPNKKAVDTMVFYNQELQEKAIGDIQTVSASFKAFNEDLETVFETEILQVPIG